MKVKHMKLKISDQFEKKSFIFNSLPSCSIINFCYYKSRWWLNVLISNDLRQPSHTMSAFPLVSLLSVSESCFESQPIRFTKVQQSLWLRTWAENRLVCTDLQTMTLWHEARRHRLFKLMEGNGEQVKRTGKWLRHTGDTWGRTWGRRRF